uniref:Uncharacterized protein n=1 Tax=Knipowitschia caucasica TaxID=637954 RepID=A0AAV2LUM1_KNICA
MALHAASHLSYSISASALIRNNLTTDSSMSPGTRPTQSISARDLSDGWGAQGGRPNRTRVSRNVPKECVRPLSKEGASGREHMSPGCGATQRYTLPPRDVQACGQSGLESEEGVQAETWPRVNLLTPLHV